MTYERFEELWKELNCKELWSHVFDIATLTPAPTVELSLKQREQIARDFVSAFPDAIAPTKWAYEQVCRANEEKRLRIKELEALSTQSVGKTSGQSSLISKVISHLESDGTGDGSVLAALLRTQPASGTVPSRDLSDVCHWNQWEMHSDTWNTSCGQDYSIIDGTPEQNGYKFCHHCGKPLVQHEFVYEEDDDE